jgi:hypothetical protein
MFTKETLLTPISLNEEPPHGTYGIPRVTATPAALVGA